MISPEEAGPERERIRVSERDEPTKLFDPSVLYPHVFTANGAGVTFADVGKVSPRLSISVVEAERKYSL